MGRYLGCIGGECLSAVDERITIISGATLTFLNATLPPDTISRRYMFMNGNKYRSWYDDAGGGLRAPSGLEYYTAFKMMGPQANASWCGTARGVNAGIGIGPAASSAARIMINGAGVFTADIGFQIATGIWDQVLFHVDHQAGGLVSVWMRGKMPPAAPDFTYVLTGGDIAALGGLPDGNYMAGGGNCNLDDVFSFDPLSGATPLTIQDVLRNGIDSGQVVTGDGFYTDWVGTFADIDEQPISDVDGITSTAVDEASTFTKGAAPGGRVDYMAVTMRQLRVGVDAGSNLQFRRREGGADEDTANMAAPAAGYLTAQYDTGVGGATLDNAEYDGTEIGPVSRT